MPTQYNMNEDSVLYRAILQYEAQPMKRERNPHYNPSQGGSASNPNYHTNQVWREYIQVPDGPEVTKERVIGPYQSIAPIKSYVTRNRGGYNGKNLRIKSIQKVVTWEDVEV